MKYEFYAALKINNEFDVFNFISSGKKGSIPKRITFTATEIENVYNLAFGDVTKDGEIDDYSRSDNGDRNKILGTILYVVDLYTTQYPHRWILFGGSTKERTRLYRKAVCNNLEALAIKFDIYAYLHEELLPFTKNMEVTAFLIKRKKA